MKVMSRLNEDVRICWELGGNNKTATLKQNTALYTSIVAGTQSLVTFKQCNMKLEDYVQYRTQYWETEGI